jgi:hypothetical protein
MTGRSCGCADTGGTEGRLIGTGFVLGFSVFGGGGGGMESRLALGESEGATLSGLIRGGGSSEILTTELLGAVVGNGKEFLAINVIGNGTSTSLSMLIPLILLCLSKLSRKLSSILCLSALP